MDKITVLVSGYAYYEDDFLAASPSVTLVESAGKKIIVDPGTNEYLLSQAFGKFQLSYSNIDAIFLSHYHPDHFLNLRLFPEVPIFDGTTKWIGDAEYPIKNTIPETTIRIIATPGHSPEHCSLMVTTAEGIVCIAQDAFWWLDGQQKSDNINDLLNHEDPFATNKVALLRSRTLILSQADIIIPGHGKMFKNYFKIK